MKDIMREYKILEYGKKDKVLVEWNRIDFTEWSIHSLIKGHLYSGDYFYNYEDAVKSFEQYK